MPTYCCFGEFQTSNNELVSSILAVFANLRPERSQQIA